MEGGWIKLHRKFTEWEWADEPNTVALFIHLLMMVTHKDKRYRGISLNPGQVITGRNALSEKTGLSVQQVRTALDHLKATNEITIKSTKRYSVVTINKWETYQIRESPSNQVNNHVSNQQVTINQPCGNHNQETKEVKKERSIETLSPESPGGGGPEREGLRQWWNGLASLHGLPAVRELSSARWKKARARGLWDKREDIAAAVAASEFVRSGSWFGFDWILSEGNLRKLLEGNYRDDRRNSGRSGSPHNTRASEEAERKYAGVSEAF